MARSSATLTRQRTPSLEVTPAVVGTALRIIGSEGHDALTVRRLAAEAGVAPMTIYNRFGDMHGVFDAVFQHGFERFAQELQASVRRLDPVLDLHRMGVAYRRFALDNPDLYRFMFLDSIADLEPSTDSSLAAARAFDVLFTVVRHGLDDARFRPGDAAVIAQEVWAACHGSVALELLGMCEFADAGTTYDSLLITILRGLLVDPAESEALV